MKYIFLLVFTFISLSSNSFAQKISALTEDTSPTTDDLTVTVDDPSGTPTSKKATIANIFKSHNIYTNGSNVGINTSTTIDSKLKIMGGGTQTELVNKSWEMVGYPTFSMTGVFFTEINSMGTYKGNLYLGYDTDSSSDKEESAIYKWDGNSLTLHSYLGSGNRFEGVAFLREYKGKLYAGQQSNTTGDGDVWVLDETDTSTPLLFNGLDSTVTVSNAATANQLFGSTAFSVEWKGKILNYGENSAGRLIDKSGSTTATTGYRLYIDSTYHVGFGLGQSALERLTVTNETVTPGVYTHIVATWASGFAPKIYINGTEATYSSSTVATTPGDDSGRQFTIGNRSQNTDRTANAWFSRVRVYRNVELTSTDVTTLYGDGTVAGATAEYLFTDGSGTTLTDSSGNGNNGTISNCIWSPGNNWVISYDDSVDKFSYSSVVYKDKLYVGGGFSVPTNILSFDGTTWTNNTISTMGLVTWMYVFNGRLFIAGGSPTTTIQSSTDGINWTIEADYPTTTYSSFNNLIEFRGKLYASVIKGSGGTNDILVRDNATGTWSVLWSAITGSQVWGMNVYNDVLYFGSTRATAEPYTSAIIYKSYDGINYSFDFEPNQLTNRFEYEAFKSITYNGSMYWGFGSGNSTYPSGVGATLWRKTDSLGQRLDNIDKISSNFRISGTNTSAQISNDKSRLSVSLPTSFDAGILSGVNWGTINGVKTNQNWLSPTPYLGRDAMNWQSLTTDISTSGVNWQSVKNNEIQSTGVNWQSINMYVDGSNIGIGTATSALLSVSSTANQDLFVVQDNGAGDGSPFVINNAGNIGIGTVASSQLINIGSTAQTTISAAGLINITNNTNSTGDLINLSGSGFTSGNALDVSSSSSGQTGGLVLITQSGSTFAGQALNVSMTGASATGNVVRFNDTSNDTTPFVIDTNGNVGIGTTTPSGIIDIRTATSSVTKKSAANQACNTTCNGTLCLLGQDSTLKDDVDCTDATADICFCMGP